MIPRWQSQHDSKAWEQTTHPKLLRVLFTGSFSFYGTQGTEPQGWGEKAQVEGGLNDKLGTMAVSSRNS